MDRGFYERIWRTGQYVLYDPETHALEGFELVGGKYVRLAPDARGCLPITSMGLALGVRPGVYQTERGSWLRWIDADGGPLPTASERLATANARADAASERADEAQRRVLELEAALRAAR